MTPERQLIAIAEACGWTPWKTVSPVDRSTPITLFEDKTGRVITELPDYLNDLNAMHEVVNSLPSTNKLEWLLWMDKLSIDPDDKKDQAWLPLRMVKAGPGVWAEAFLRTIGKWEDE